MGAHQEAEEDLAVDLQVVQEGHREEEEVVDHQEVVLALDQGKLWEGPN